MSVFVIAEAGVNHDGDIAKAKALIDMSAEAGADAVKFQTFTAAKVATASLRKATYQSRQDPSLKPQYDMLKALELSHTDHFALKAHCELREIAFLSSAFDEESLDFLIDDLGQGMIKFGSGELTNLPLLVRAARKDAELILSTGMATLADIELALSAIAFALGADGDEAPSLAGFRQSWAEPAAREIMRAKTSILQCTSSYPAPIADANLAAMATIRSAFGCRTGYSDHTLGCAATLAAVALGAELIEKHVTLDQTLPGPDHAASMEPAEFRRLVSDIRDVEAAIGTSVKMPAACERDTAAVARKRLVAACDIAEGEAFTRQSIAIKRSERGLEPAHYWDILGRRATRDYRRDDAIEF